MGYIVCVLYTVCHLLRGVHSVCAIYCVPPQPLQRAHSEGETNTELFGLHVSLLTSRQFMLIHNGHAESRNFTRSPHDPPPHMSSLSWTIAAQQQRHSERCLPQEGQSRLPSRAVMEVQSHCRVVCKSKNLSMKASSCTCSDNICPTSVPWRYHGIYDASTYHERAPAKTTPSHQQLRSSLNLYLAMLPEV